MANFQNDWSNRAPDAVENEAGDNAEGKKEKDARAFYNARFAGGIAKSSVLKGLKKAAQ